MIKAFPYNPVINYIEYNDSAEEMKIHFKKKNEIRTYAQVPKEIFYAMYYLQSSKELLSYYAKNLREKFRLIEIKPLGK